MSIKLRDNINKPRKPSCVINYDTLISFETFNGHFESMVNIFVTKLPDEDPLVKASICYIIIDRPIRSYQVSLSQSVLSWLDFYT